MIAFQDVASEYQMKGRATSACLHWKSETERFCVLSKIQPKAPRTSFDRSIQCLVDPTQREMIVLP